jgi:hypothetical protein
LQGSRFGVPRQAEMRPLEEFGDEEPKVTAGAAMCNACEGCDLSRDWVVDSGGEMDLWKNLLRGGG